MTYLLFFYGVVLHIGGYLGAVSAIERGYSITLNVAISSFTSVVSALIFAYAFMQM